VLLPPEELASLEETVFWLRDEADRTADGEASGEGEQGPGLSEDEVRARYGHLLPHRDTA
jgi:hypothetical protein